MSLSLHMATAAEEFTAESARLLIHQDSRFHDRQRLLDSEVGGDAFELAALNLGDSATALAAPAHQMQAIAHVLTTYGQLRAQAEALHERLVDRTLGASKEAIVPLIEGIRGIGEAIDFMCAAHIDALCTPEMAAPPERLEDFAGLPLGAIHELHLATAPPHVAELATTNPDVTLLEVSEGRLVAMIHPAGAVQTHPASVTTFVNGVGSSDPGTWHGSLARARSMANATGGPVVAWLGYSAPPSISHGTASEPARSAAQELARFNRSLAARYPGARHTVVGYSYGSVVAGQAAAHHGLHADNLVIVGSPGVGAASASDLRLHGTDGPGRVHAVTAIGDPIAWTTSAHTGVHGPDPTGRSFGATPWPHRITGGHGSYFDDPTFLAHLGALARGNAGP